MPEKKRPSAAKKAAKKKQPVAKQPAQKRPGAAGRSPNRGAKAAPPFPVVGVGASAGGLDALEKLFAKLPADTGMAFVVITHTDPKHTSMLPEIIERRTQLKVRVIEDRMAAAPDTIYLPPSDHDPLIANGTFSLKKRVAKREIHMPVDLFLKQLAVERRERSGCVILSGTGSDGTHGLRAVKENGGLAVVQDPATAQHAGMPDSAIDTGLVDFVLPPDTIAGRLADYFRHPVAAKPVSNDAERKPPDRIRQILAFLAKRTRHDFSLYKTSTLQRRIGRRLAVTRSRDTEAYLQVLYQNNDEVQALFHDLLIGVTSFFRDPEAFEQLETQVLPELLAKRRPGAALRVWIPGCATGEETYSVAILLKEIMEKKEISCDLQIFGTDIDPRAIEKARSGLYLPNIAADISAERLKRFFNKEGDGYRIRREIREPVVFAEQNLLRDPPFSELDLLVCRNLLIYLRSEAQDRLIPLFHYTLKKDGILFLGNSETIGRFPELFDPLSKSHSIFRKRDRSVSTRIHFPTGRNEPAHLAEEGDGKDDGANQSVSLEASVEKILMQAFAPACLVVDPKGQILYTHGRTGQYLELPPGKPNLNVADMAREGLRFALTTALRKARETKEALRETGLQVRTNGEHQWVDLTVRRLDKSPHKDALMLVFQNIPAPQPQEVKRPAEDRDAETDEDARIQELEQELMRLRQEYRSAREELETSNEELRSANEEMHSSNEELQSTNEELESSREELQSLNEELNTVNDELQNKIQELRESYQAVTETLNSTRMAIVMLDRELCVTRFTQAATKLINLIDSDLGRPLEHISTALEVDDLSQMAAKVVDTLQPIEREVRAEGGSWYRMNVMIRRSGNHVIEGVVMTFVNIDPQKEAQAKLEAANRRSLSAQRLAESMVDASREALLVLDDELKVVTANRRFYEHFRTDGEKTIGRFVYDLGDGQWDIPDLRRLLEAVTEKHDTFEDYRITHEFPEIGQKIMLLNARHLREDDEKQNKILLAIEDLTDRLKADGGS
jgi:two-component system CheB/CheR fusion protein